MYTYIIYVNMYNVCILSTWVFTSTCVHNFESLKTSVQFGDVQKCSVMNKLHYVIVILYCIHNIMDKVKIHSMK